MNALQDGTPYDGRPVGNCPGFMPLDHILDRDILHSFLFSLYLEPFFARRGGNRLGGEECLLQFLYTKGNRHRTEAYMVIENGNTFFGEDYPRCRSGVEIFGN